MKFLKYLLSHGSQVHFIDGQFVEPLGITNPSIIKHNGKILLSARTCEYTFFNFRTNNPYTNRSLSWFPLSMASNVPVNYYSRNHILELNGSFDVVSKTELLPNQFERKLFYNGAEDIRLAETENGDLSMSYSLFEEQQNVSMNIAVLDDSYNVKESYKFSPTSHEKNWMPVLDRPGHYVRTAFGDIVELKDGNFIHHGDENAPLEYRGSSQLVPYKDTYICTVHIGEYYDENDIVRMRYKSKFIQTDKTYNVINQSEWFSFCNMPIEFSCGMMIDGDRVLIPFSLFDSITLVLETDISLILSFMNGTYKTNTRFVSPYDEFSDIVLNKNGLDAVLSLDKHLVSRYPNNEAIRLACLTHVGSYETNKKAALDYYTKALCEIKNFTTGMFNHYLHVLLGQDMIINTIQNLL